MGIIQTLAPKWDTAGAMFLSQIISFALHLVNRPLTGGFVHESS